MQPSPHKSYLKLTSSKPQKAITHQLYYKRLQQRTTNNTMMKFFLLLLVSILLHQAAHGAKFPMLVDIRLMAGCIEVPPSLNSDDVFSEVILKFNELVPGMEDIEPGQPYINSRGTGNGKNRNGKVRRRLLTVCPKCKKASNWKKCIKNKCKGGGRRRVLVKAKNENEALRKMKQVSDRLNSLDRIANSETLYTCRLGVIVQRLK